jgi:hypothetical protein
VPSFSHRTQVLAGAIMPSEFKQINDGLYSASVVGRFQQHYTVGRPEECWIWNRKLDNGYGRFWVDGRTELAHRIAYEQAVGPIRPGLHIDQAKARSCTNLAFVGPAHVEPLTHAARVLPGGDHNAA